MKAHLRYRELKFDKNKRYLMRYPDEESCASPLAESPLSFKISGDYVL